MGVGHQHRVDIAGMEGQAAVIHLVPALLQAAVDQYPLAVDLQAVAAAGNAPVGAKKTQFHGVNSFFSLWGWGCFLLLFSIPRFSPLHNRKPVRLPDNCSQKFFCIRQKSVVYSISIAMYKILRSRKDTDIWDCLPRFSAHTASGS